jgi:hypothetical protein
MKTNGLPDGRNLMTEYYVAGVAYLDLQGDERFTLLGPNTRNHPS